MKLPCLVILIVALAAGVCSCGGSKVVVVTATSAPASPTAPVTPIATVSPASSATVGPTVAPQDVVQADANVVVARGFQPVEHHAETPDGFGNTLYAFWGICKDSGDGKCQKVFFFIGSRLLGTDTSAPSSEINDVQPDGTGTIAVTYAHYLPQDPLCCPHGKPVTITYHWNGARLIPSGTPPGH